MRDYYSLLEVPRNAPPEDILRANRRLAHTRHPVENPDNKADVELRFMKISEAYRVLPGESKSPQYDFQGRGGKNAGHQVDFARAQVAKVYNTGGAFTFTNRDPDELFREFFGSWDPFQAMFHIMHGGQYGLTVLTGGFPLYQQNPGSTFRTDFFIPSENLLLAPHLSASGANGRSAGFVTMPTQQASSLDYVNGKRMETRTIIRDGLMTAFCFEDGQLVSHTAARAAHESAPDASPVTTMEMPGYRQRGEAPDFCAPSLFGGCVSAQPSSTTKGVYGGNSGAPAGSISARMSLGGRASASCSAPTPSRASSNGGRNKKPLEQNPQGQQGEQGVTSGLRGRCRYLKLRDISFLATR